MGLVAMSCQLRAMSCFHLSRLGDQPDQPNKPDQPEMPNSRPDPEGIILLEQFEDKLKGKFVVVTDNKVRFTDLGGLQ